MSETRARSAAKSLSWRAVATLTTILLVFAFTGEVRVAITVGAAEVVAKLVIFYFHERIWDRFSWGERPGGPPFPGDPPPPSYRHGARPTSGP